MRSSKKNPLHPVLGEKPGLDILFIISRSKSMNINKSQLKHFVVCEQTGPQREANMGSLYGRDRFQIALDPDTNERTTDFN